MIKLNIIIVVLLLINIVLTSVYISNIKKETFDDIVRNYKKTLCEEYRRFLKDN